MEIPEGEEKQNTTGQKRVASYIQSSERKKTAA